MRHEESVLRAFSFCLIWYFKRPVLLCLWNISILIGIPFRYTFMYKSMCKLGKDVICMAQIKVNDLTFYYEGSYDNIFEHVNLQIDTDWRCGLIGRNGKGKTTFLKLLTGAFEYSGSITGPMECVYFPYTLLDEVHPPRRGMRYGVPVGYTLSENAHPSQTTMELLEELNPNYELWKVCRELGELSVDPEVLNRSFCTLSGGEQTKILLALLFS